MKLTLLRHGITRGNRDDLCYGSTDLPLLEEGRERLQQQTSCAIYPKAAHYYTSGMLRTEQTLELIYGKVPHDVLPALREIRCGVLEMTPFSQLQDCEIFRQWMSDPTGQAHPEGAESVSQVRERGVAEIRRLIALDEDAVCVMHGGIIALIMETLLPGRPFEDYMPQPGTGFQITLEGGKPVSYCAAPM